MPGLQGGPLDHVMAAKAVAFREAATPEFAEYARQILANASVLAAALAAQGFRIVSGGTDNHLMVLDLRPFDEELSGKKARDPRAKLIPGIYDAGEAAMGIKHVLLVKKPDAFQLGSDNPDDPKVQKTLGSDERRLLED